MEKAVVTWYVAVKTAACDLIPRTVTVRVHVTWSDLVALLYVMQVPRF